MRIEAMFRAGGDGAKDRPPLPSMKATTLHAPKPCNRYIPATSFSSLRLCIRTESLAKPYPRPRSPILVDEDHSSGFESLPDPLEVLASAGRHAAANLEPLNCSPADTRPTGEVLRRPFQ